MLIYEWRDIIDWPCKKCESKNVRETRIDEDYNDWKFECKDCKHTWIEEGADA